MKPEFHSLRIKHLSQQLKPFLELRSTARPWKGWLSAMREISGITLKELAGKLKTSPQVVAALQKSEAADRITLRKLRAAADALNCELIYALVPKTGSVQDFAEAKMTHEVDARIRAVEHSMMLEDQAVGGVEEKIKEELRFRSKKK
jgi:predicted DNA-binding mobile mystery protein A